MYKIAMVLMISLCSSVLAMDPAVPRIESLKQKQVILHVHNMINIISEEALLPTNNPQVNLALIHNNVTFLQEDEVKDLSQDTATLFCLIGAKHFNPDVKPLTKEFVQKCTSAHPEFVSKLFDKKTLQQAYTDLPQQVALVSKKINQLGNDELKSLLHALVTFYTVENEENREEAVALVKALHKKYPAIIPTFAWNRQCLNLGEIGIPQRNLPSILTIDMYY